MTQNTASSKTCDTALLAPPPEVKARQIKAYSAKRQFIHNPLCKNYHYISLGYFYTTIAVLHYHYRTSIYNKQHTYTKTLQ